ncbi:7-carboxy-7-deazaguanine synthase QueE, partial [Acidobacteriota bacterium]
MKVVEIYLSIQGESSFQGLPTSFIRLAGCNLACSYCDTAYARNPDEGIEMAVEDAVSQILSFGTGYA